jgi:hypothetical protein
MGEAGLLHHLGEIAAIAVGDLIGGDMIATAIFIGVIALPALIKWHKSRIKEGKRGVEPSHLIIGGVAAIIIGGMVALTGILWQTYWPHSVDSQGTSALANVPAGLSPKFYSTAQKEKLSDLCGSLIETLDKNGSEIATDTANLMGRSSYQRQIMQRPGSLPDTKELRDLYQKLINVTVVLNKSLYDQDGIIKSNPLYAQEIQEILTNNGEKIISGVQVAANNISYGIAALEQAKGEQRLLEAIFAATQQNLLALQSADDAFRAWIQESKVRAGRIRQTL